MNESNATIHMGQHRENKKAEAENVVKKLLVGGMSADEILEKLK